MQIKTYLNSFHYLFYFLIILFLQINIPVISDDWFFINNENYFIYNRPLSSYLITYLYPLINFQFYIFDSFMFLKALYLFIIYIIFIYILAKLKFSSISPLYISFLIIFYPLHDSSTYWIWSIIHFLSFSLSMLSFVFYNDRKLFLANSIIFISLMLSYSCLPVVLFLLVYFIKFRNYKNILNILFIFLVYIIYIITISDLNNLPRVGIGYNNFSDKIINILNFKNFTFHLISLFDIIGPSNIIKIYNSFLSINLISFLYILLISFLVTSLYFKRKSLKLNLSLIIFFLIIALFSLLLFIITTKFPYIPFGLGNRVNLFISPFIILMIVYLISLTRIYYLRFAIFLIFNFILISSIYSTNLYWKEINYKMEVFNNNIMNLPKDKIIFLKNEKYFIYNLFKHIEFLNNDFYLDNYFLTYNLNKDNIYLLNSKNIYLNKNKINEYIVYDVRNNNIKNYKNIDDINNIYLSYDDRLTRHWSINLIKNKNLLNFLPDYYRKKIN